MEWQKEPNQLSFIYKGYHCHIKRNPGLGILLGYVQVLSKAPEEPLNLNLDCHGGLTFEGESEGQDGYWIGFDCGHCVDLMPWVHRTYKSIDFVQRNIEGLVDQLLLQNIDMKM